MSHRPTWLQPDGPRRRTATTSAAVAPIPNTRTRASVGIRPAAAQEDLETPTTANAPGDVLVIQAVLVGRVASEPERVPAVGHDRLTGDPGGLVRGKQEDATGNVGGLGLAVDHLAAQAGIHDGLGDPFGHRGPGQ